MSPRPPQRLRAPRQDQAVLAEPALAQAREILARNRLHLAGIPGTLFGKPWTTLRREARLAALHVAADYFRRTGEPVPSFNASSLVMAGHQPELFHPGVWVKNFVLNGLARHQDATPLNLVVDNDIARAKGLHVPVPIDPQAAQAAQAAVRLGLVPFDQSTADEPYEEHAVTDENFFAGFPERLAGTLGGWSFQPLAAEFWSEVMRQARHMPLLGERFATARRAVERRWGCHNLELPVSLLCGTEPFAWFACHLLAELPRFHAIYNSCVQDYRARHGLRSRNHPVPDLGAAGDWLESPFWAWRAGQKRRGRLFARQANGFVELRAGDDGWPKLPLPFGNNAEPMLHAWRDLEKTGFKVRSRALTNTMFARLFLADLFIHGIGGAKYDEVTDAIVRRFHGIEPAGYLVVSATLLLPLPTFDVRSEDQRRLARILRDLKYNPQRHLENLAGNEAENHSREIAAEKLAWIARQPRDKNERKARFRKLRALNDLLNPFLVGKGSELRRSLASLDAQLQANAVLQRRDYAFCLFPEEKLRPFCTQFLSPIHYGCVQQ